MGWIASQQIGRRWPSITQPGGGGGATYGPTAGRSTVIAEATPRMVSTPGGSTVSFSSASDLQSKIDTNASSTVFIPTAGWTDWSQRVLPNNKNPRIYVPGAPGSRIFDAGDRALFSMIGGGLSTDVIEIHGGWWRNVGNNSGNGHVIAAGQGSLIEDVMVSDAYDAGIRISGDNVTIRYAEVFDNGADGISNPGLGNDALVHHVELYGNGHRDPDAVPDHGGSGKWSGGANASGTIEYCYAHEVWDYGPWNDGAGAWIIRENVFEDCRKAAPFFEIMTQGGEVTHCYLARNGETATGGEYFFANVMTIACCDTAVGKQVLVQWNHIEGAERLIALNNQASRPNTKRVNIVDNEIKFTNTAARVGGEDSQTVDTLFTEPTITWDRNRYIAPNTTGTYWHWDGEKTFAQWQATGRDTNSTIEVG